jgi:hypothetical protein
MTAHTHSAVETLLDHIRAWWQGRDTLSGIDAHEFERIAADLGVSAGELRELSTRGPHAADLLLERMKVLGLTKADIEHTAAGLMRDLQKTCSYCADKGVCERDLVKHPDQQGWQHYCPNSDTLESIAKTKARFPA